LYFTAHVKGFPVGVEKIFILSSFSIILVSYIVYLYAIFLRSMGGGGRRSPPDFIYNGPKWPFGWVSNTKSLHHHLVMFEQNV
jgi:hypothetical protein